MSSSDAVDACLALLARHVARAEVAITGSVAIGARRPNDLDLVVSRRSVVETTVAADFLIVHHHQGDRLILQLVEPRSRVRVDVFFDRFGAIATAHARPDGWLVVEPAVLFEHKLELLARASPERPVDPKHAEDARVLAGRLGRAIPAIDPRSLRAEVYSTDLSAGCERCEAALDPAFPLASRAAVFELLGYV